METKEGVNLKSIETEELLRELRMRDDVVISSWSIDDIATEIEYQAHRQGIELDDKAPVIELAALALKFNLLNIVNYPPDFKRFRYFHDFSRKTRPRICDLRRVIFFFNGSKLNLSIELRILSVTFFIG